MEQNKQEQVGETTEFPKTETSSVTTNRILAAGTNRSPKTVSATTELDTTTPDEIKGCNARIPLISGAEGRSPVKGDTGAPSPTLRGANQGGPRSSQA